MQKIYSLSHVDLDGYSCQMVIKEANPKADIIYFNANYGDIDGALDKIMKVIEKYDILFITDLNLTLEQSQKLNSYKIDKGFNLQLLDHHISGEESAKKYTWYILDTSKSATKITYDYFGTLSNSLDYTVNLVDTYDMWRKENKDFNKSQLLSNLVFENKIDSGKNTEFMIELTKRTGKLLEILDIQKVEMLLPSLISDVLQGLTQDKNIIKILESKDIATSVKLGIFPVTDIQDRIFCNILINGIDTVFFKDISSKTSQYAFDYLLGSFSFKDKVLVNYKEDSGTLSCRSRNSKAIEVAKFFGGGGHPDASGAKLEDGKIIEDYIGI